MLLATAPSALLQSLPYGTYKHGVARHPRMQAHALAPHQHMQTHANQAYTLLMQGSLLSGVAASVRCRQQR